MERLITIFTYLLIMALSYWIIAIIHELGHVIVGLAHGWKLLLLVVGFVGLKRKDNKLVLHFKHNLYDVIALKKFCGDAGYRENSEGFKYL